MKKYLLITLMATALSAAAQQTPTNKIRSNSDYSHVDNYLVALKRLGIPTSDTDNLDALGLPQNTIKMIFNTTLGRLRIYNPVLGTWADATAGNLAEYLPLSGGTLTGTLTGTAINADLFNSDDGINSALIEPTIMRMKTGANEVYLNSDKITFQQAGPSSNTITQQPLTGYRHQQFPDADGTFLTDQTGVQNTRAISDSYQSGGLALSTGKFGQLAVNMSEPAGNFHVRGTSFLDASSGGGGVQFYGVAEGGTGGINIGSAAENVAPSNNHYPLIQDVNTGLMKRSSKRGLYEGDVPVSPSGEFIYASPSVPQNASISLDNADIRISGNRFQGLYAPRVRVNTITDNNEYETPGLNIASSSSLSIGATTNMSISADQELFFNMGGTGSSILLGNYNLGGVERLALSGAKVELVETPPVATSNYSLLVRQDNGGELKTIDGNTFITKNTSTLPLNDGTNNLGFQKNSDDTFTANGYMNIKSVAGAPIASIGEAYNTFYGAMVLTDNPAYPGYNYFETQNAATGNRASLRSSGISFNTADGYLNFVTEGSITGGHNVTFPTPATINAKVAYSDTDGSLTAPSYNFNNGNSIYQVGSNMYVNLPDTLSGISFLFNGSGALAIGKNGISRASDGQTVLFNTDPINNLHTNEIIFNNGNTIGSSYENAIYNIVDPVGTYVYRVNGSVVMAVNSTGIRDGAGNKVLVEGEASQIADTVTSAPTPTSSGVKGKIIVTGGYRYECIAANTWVRSVVETSW